jgi:hypothetical protein
MSIRIVGIIVQIADLFYEEYATPVLGGGASDTTPRTIPLERQ